MKKKNNLLNTQYSILNTLCAIRSKKAVTFVELLIVTATFAIVSLALYATLSSGLKVWQKTNQSLYEEDAIIFLERFSTDVRNSFRFNTIDFSGKEEKLEFASLVSSPRLGETTVGRVTYAYNSGSRQIERRISDFSCVYTRETPLIQQALKDVRSLQFQYYSFAPQKKEYLWQKEWDKKHLPLAVRITLEADAEGKNYAFTKTLSIPASKKESDEE